MEITRIVVPIPLRQDSLCYVKEEAARRGIPMEELVANFIEEGMLRQTQLAEFAEMIESILAELSDHRERVEKIMDSQFRLRYPQGCLRLTS